MKCFLHISSLSYVCNISLMQISFGKIDISVPMEAEGVGGGGGWTFDWRVKLFSSVLCTTIRVAVMTMCKKQFWEIWYFTASGG